MRQTLAIAICLLAGLCGGVASDRGQEVVVVYNSRLAESKEIAEHYAQRRGVPPTQVIGLPLSANTEMTRADFRSTLQRPLAKALSERKLWQMDRVRLEGDAASGSASEWRTIKSSIRYAVLSYGIPYRILPDPELKEEGTETWRPELRRNEAAVDSELALLPVIEQNILLAGPHRNLFYQATNAAQLHPTNGILMVTRLDGPTPEIARRLVDKALEAETNGLWGRAYFDLRSIKEPGYIPGDISIRNASETCRRLGFETIVDTNSGTFPASFPMSQIAIYVGWYDETVSGPFTEPGVEFMPGAFAYHLHSFSAASLRSTNRNWVGPLLTLGATITMGAVYEPYLGGTPDMAIFVSRLLYDGFTFGEAAYAAQSVLSWQITVVGDPLYAPGGKNHDDLYQELLRRKSPWTQWSLLKLTNLNLANGRSAAEAVTFIESLELRTQSAVLTEKLASLYDSLGKPASALQTYAQVLKLDPSPVQRLRIRLILGEKFEASGREKEAYENYQRLLEEMPYYAGKPAIQQRLDALAQKLGSPTEPSGNQDKSTNKLNEATR